MIKRYSLVRIPKKVDRTLFLLCEELKSNKFFEGLSKVGVDDIYYQPHLMSVILEKMGFKEISDDLVSRYIDLLSKYSGKIMEDRKSITKHAFRFYIDLLMEKEKVHL